MQGKSAALTGDAVNGDVAAVSASQFAGDGQAQTRASHLPAAGLGHAVKALKKIELMFHARRAIIVECPRYPR